MDEIKEFDEFIGSKLVKAYYAESDNGEVIILEFDNGKAVVADSLSVAGVEV